MPGKITVYMYITVAVALVAVCMLYNYSSWFIIGAYCSQGVQARWFLKGQGMKYLTQYFSHKFTPPMYTVRNKIQISAIHHEM